MIIYFADRKMQILGQASTNLNDGIFIVDDNKTEYVSNGVVIFEATVCYGDTAEKYMRKLCTAGNYLLRKHNAENEFYTIIDREFNEENREVTLYCEDAGMDLLNTIAEKYEASQAYTAVGYIDEWIRGTGFEIGVNEISNLKRKLKWDGESTVAERIASIATQFDNAEVSYSFEVEGMTVKKLLINLWKKRGKDAKIQLRLGRDVKNIRDKESVQTLATALRVTGGTPEGGNEPITLLGYHYDDGDIYTDGKLLKSRSAVAKWGSTWSNGKHIERTYSFETTSQSELCAHAVTELKKLSSPTKTYEVDIVTMPDNLSIGDIVYIVNDRGELYVSSRLLELKTSVSGKKIEAKLGDFVEEDSGIDDQVKNLADKLANINVSPGSTASTLSLTVESSKGVVFTDTLVDTTLTAHVYKDGRELTASEVANVGKVIWYKNGTKAHEGTSYRVRNVEAARVSAQLEV
jgi:phage minor structural protein, N-terminal domain protein|nr:MAG TPA: tail protein [Caudoviricetes sp.]